VQIEQCYMVRKADIFWADLYSQRNFDRTKRGCSPEYIIEK